MANESLIQLFEGNKVRIIWNEEEEKYYFSVVDIVQVLTESVNPTDYIKKMKVRDKELSQGWGQIVTPLAYQTAGGKSRVRKSIRSHSPNREKQARRFAIRIA